MSPISPPCDSFMPICPWARVQRACTPCELVLAGAGAGAGAGRPPGVRRLLQVQSITAASVYPASVQCSIAADTARVCACECPRAQANHQPPTTNQQGWAGLVRSALRLRLRLRLSLAATHGDSFPHALNTPDVWNTRSHRTASLSSPFCSHGSALDSS